MDIFRITQKIEIIEENWDSGKKQFYFSRIEDVLEDSFLITPPFRKGFYLPKKRGRSIVARVPADNCSYLFESVLLEIYSSPFPLWEISLPRTIKRTQMREHVRLDIAIAVEIEFIGTSSSGRRMITSSRNISAGGALMILPEKVPVSTKFNMTLSLAPQDELQVEGEIVRIIPKLQEDEEICAGIKFSKIDEKNRQKIIKFIFQKQLERRNKDRNI